MQKSIFKLIFGYQMFISEQSFENFAALFKTFKTQKDHRVMFLEVF